MKILFVHHNYGDLGGAELYVRDMARALAARGHNCGILFNQASNRNVDLWNSIFPTRWQWRSSAEVQATIGAFDPDVVFLNNESDLSVLHTLKQSEVRIVKVIHDHNLYCLRSYRYNYFTRTICERPLGLHCVTTCLACVTRKGFSLKSYSEKKQELAIAGTFDNLIAVSNYIKAQLILNGCEPAKISVIHPVPQVEPALAQEKKNLIVCPAQIIRGKGIDYLLRALKELKVPYECVILGDGSYRKTCEKLAIKLKLGSSVKFTGYVPRQQVADYLARASVVAVPSTWAEPCALVGVEAITLGLPVVGFAVGGNSDWLKDGVNGYLVPQMDYKGFAAKLERLLTDTQLAYTMGQNGMLLAAKEFDFNKQLLKVEAVLAGTLVQMKSSEIYAK